MDKSLPRNAQEDVDFSTANTLSAKPGQANLNVAEAIVLDPSGSASKLHTYQPLAESSFRVLRLEPGKSADELKGTLQHFSFMQRPHYRALSYTWGESNFTETLHIDGAVLKITPSLAVALRRFRETTTPVNLWCDQICINQEDLEERQRQVATMGSIYGHAKEVLVWLGEEVDSDIHNFWLLHRLSSCNHEFEHSEHTEQLCEWLSEQYRDTENVECPCCYRSCPNPARSFDEGLDLLGQDFWTRPWFTRLWVIQEFHSGRRSTLYCGQHTLSSYDLQALLDSAYGSILRRSEVRHVFHSLTHIRRFIYFLPHSRPIRRLVTMLLNLTELRCSDERDRAYAIASLCTLDEEHSLTQDMFNSPMQWPLSFLEPDYRIPASQLWLKLARSFIESCSTWNDTDVHDVHPFFFLALSGTQDEPSRVDLPWSWVPDFSRLGQRAFHKRHQYMLKRESFYAGGAITQCESPILDDGETLRFRGKTVSTVRSILPTSHFPVFTDELMVHPFGHTIFTTQHMIPWYYHCRHFMEQHRTNLDSEIVRELIHRGPNTTSYEDIADDETVFAGFEMDRMCEELNVLLAEFDPQKYDEFDHYQVLAVLDDGRFAWVPEKSEIGNTVALLPTCHFPFILRAIGEGQYRICGDAYVEGTTQGQLWPQERGELNKIIIV